jgi:hypothetical protein
MPHGDRNYFLNSAVWVVKCGCISLSQILNAHIAGVASAAAARRPKNRRKNEGRFPARFAPLAKTEPNHGNFVNRCDRFLKLKRLRAPAIQRKTAQALRSSR